MSIRMPNNEFAPDQPGLINDPLILSNMSGARKGYALNRTVLLAIGLFFLLAFTGLILYARGTPAGPDFNGQLNHFAHTLMEDHPGQSIQISRLDAYYRDSWYYWDVTYTAGTTSLHRVYCCHPNTASHQSFDPAILEQSLLLSDKQLFSSWQLAQSKGKSKHYSSDELTDYLASLLH